MTMIAYRMVQSMAVEARGIVDETICFHAVFVDPIQQVKKGLFVPLERGAETLKTAIEHGAIGSFWPLGDRCRATFLTNFHFFSFRRRSRRQRHCLSGI